MRGLDWLALCVGLPLLACWWLLAEFAGYPTSDDPFYGRPAQIMADEGRFQLVTQAGELSASSVAHIVIGGGLARLVGFDYRTLYLAVILQMWLAAIALYALARSAGCDRWFACLWAGVFLYNPLCFVHAFTFMTDGPAMSWALMAVCLFRTGVQRLSLTLLAWLWLLGGSVLVGVAFWMRQTHVMLCGFPVASLGLLAIGKQISWRQCMAGWLASVAPAACAVLLFESGLLVFGNGLSGEQGRLHVVVPRGIDWYQTTINIYGVGLLIGFLLLPWLPYACRLTSTRALDEPAAAIRGSRTWQRWTTAGIACLWSLPLILTGGGARLMQATGSVLADTHAGPIFLSDFEIADRWGDMGGVTWPSWTWIAVSILAITNWSLLSGWVVAVLSRDWLRLEPPPQLARQSAILSGLLLTCIPIAIVILSVRTGVQDRYWMLLLLLVFAIVPELGQVCRVGWNARGWATLLLLAQVALSVVLVRDFLTWNQLRWQQVERWLADGMLPEEIDGGRDINAWYRSAEDYATLPRPGDTSTWWSGRAKVALAIGPREGWIETGRLKWTAWATGREHEILLLRKQ